MFRYQGDKKFTKGNSVKLLKDGDAFLPQMIRRIRKARYEIFIETFILANDRTGLLVQKALLQAAKRGVWIAVTADSYGTFYLDEEYIKTLTDAGIIFQIYDPQPRFFDARTKAFRCLHRKLVVVDGACAFLGGINLCDDHITSMSATAKRDFAVEVVGPVVREIRRLCQSYVREARDEGWYPKVEVEPHPQADGPCEVAFVSRDNKRNRSEIEKAYIAQIRNAKSRVLIANAYFFPGYRVMRALKKASQRGVAVDLILQGNPDIPFALPAARCLYDTLTKDGISVHEYVERPLHAKVAIIDDEWSTVGSSNLDPWSLSMNLEANVFIKSKELNRELAENMAALMQKSRLIRYDSVQRRDWWSRLRNTITYHGLRHLPNLISWVPNHRPKIREIRTLFEADDGESLDPQLRHNYPESRNARRVVYKRDYSDAGGV